jgi:hypothetical protein
LSCSEASARYPPEYSKPLQDMISFATGRLDDELTRHVPFLAGRVGSWMSGLAVGAHPVSRLVTPEMFPMFLLPWWLARTLRADPEEAFESDLVYSTINGYYSIRLIDDIMDGEGASTIDLLPVAAFFHSRFQRSYSRHFGPDHDFWIDFDASWLGSAELAYRDQCLVDVDHPAFAAVAGRKSCASHVPVAAVCHHYGRSDLILPWIGLCDLFGCFHQMLDDFVDWRRDALSRRPTLFLTEARRRKDPDETLFSWVLREGCMWAFSELERWMEHLRETAEGLGSVEASRYLTRRGLALRDWKKELIGGMHELARLRQLFPCVIDEEPRS